MTDQTTAQAIASAPDPGAALREVIDAEVAAAVGRALGEAADRIESKAAEAHARWIRDRRGRDFGLYDGYMDALRVIRASRTHDCASCDDCVHDGHKCCGCYDGACCRDLARGGAE